MMTPAVRALVKLLSGLDHRDRPSRTFEAFVDAAYCALAKLANPDRADALEAEFGRIAGRYGREVIAGLSQGLGILQGALIDTDGQIDVLGPAAAELGALNGGQGQFFTPYELAALMAQMTLGDLAGRAPGDVVTVSDPAVGSGAQLLAAHAHLRESGYVGLLHGADISRLAARMAYVQLTLAGAAALIEVRDSLASPDVPADERAVTLMHHAAPRARAVPVPRTIPLDLLELAGI